MSNLLALTLTHFGYIPVIRSQNKAKPRKCIGCNKLFPSSWSGDRKCRNCEKIELGLEYGKTVRHNELGRYVRKEVKNV